ncbi:MAG: ORF6N domain-containing protein [Acidobacteriota bacterium]
MFDYDLAELYGVPTKVLNQAVRRNLERFPEDFMFQLSQQEVDVLYRSQIVTGSQKHRDPRYLPYVFTQEGVAMLSSALRSKRAIMSDQHLHHEGFRPLAAGPGIRILPAK